MFSLISNTIFVHRVTSRSLHILFCEISWGRKNQTGSNSFYYNSFGLGIAVHLPCYYCQSALLCSSRGQNYFYRFVVSKFRTNSRYATFTLRCFQNVKFVDMKVVLNFTFYFLFAWFQLAFI